MLKIRRLDPTDTDGLLLLVDRLGWTFTSGDFRTAFAAGQLFGHPHGQEIISCIAVFNYGNGLASIGAVMVDPAFRRRGLGRALMNHVHDLREVRDRQIMLVSTIEGRPLYEALGYSVATRLNKMVSINPGPTSSTRESPIHLRPAVEKDLSEIIQLDEVAIGEPRENLLAARYEQACATVVAINERGSAIGFALAADQRGQLICGPVVAPDDATAHALIVATAREHRGETRVDVPDTKTGLIRLLSSAGFRRESHPPLMVRHREKGLRHGPLFYAPMAQIFG